MTDPEFVIPFDRLPDGFAESVEGPVSRPTTPRPAATIVLLRDGAPGPEVLLMRRSRSAGFVPGAYVFPGGRVDAADASPPIVARLDGLDADAAARRLDHADAEPGALAYYLAAVREAFEETGILIARTTGGGTPPSAATDPSVDAVREGLMEDRVGFADALDRLDARIDGRAIEYLAHWITPEVEPRRYDTRFFAAKVPSDASAIVDPREMTDALWLTPDAALRRNRQATLPMVFPTIKTLQQLAGFESVDAILRDLAGRSIPTILPRLVVTPTGVGLQLD